MNRCEVMRTAVVTNDTSVEKEFGRVEQPAFGNDRREDHQEDLKQHVLKSCPVKTDDCLSGNNVTQEEDHKMTALRKRVEALKARLKEVEDKTNEDIEKIKVGVEEEITKGREKISVSKASQLANRSNNEELEEQGVKAKDTIASLRMANKKLREEGRDLPRQILELKAHNKALEESNEAFEKAMGELRERFDSEKADNEKLNEVVKQYQAKILEFETPLESRSDLGEVERKTKTLYCNFNVKIVDLVVEKSNDKAFMDEIVAIQEKGLASSGKSETESTNNKHQAANVEREGATSVKETEIKSDASEATFPVTDSDDSDVDKGAR